MTSRFLYPRVAQPLALAFLNEHHGCSPEDLREAASMQEWRRHYYAVGARVDESRIRQLAEDLHAAAVELGYPEPLEDRSNFDRVLSLRLLDEPILDVGAAGVWAHLGAALMPHLTLWRWGWPEVRDDEAGMSARKAERFLGGFRNTFRRGWYRVWQFGAGDEDPPATFWEDALFNIEERPSLGGNRRVASRIFWATSPWTDKVHRSYREDAFREVVKECTQIGAVTDFSAVDDEALRRIVTAAVLRRVPDKHKDAFERHLAGKWPASWTMQESQSA